MSLHPATASLGKPARRVGPLPGIDTHRIHIGTALDHAPQIAERVKRGHLLGSHPVHTASADLRPAVRRHLTNFTDFQRSHQMRALTSLPVGDAMATDSTLHRDVLVTESLASAHELAKAGFPVLAMRSIKAARQEVSRSENSDRGSLHRMINAYEMHLRFAYGIEP